MRHYDIASQLQYANVPYRTKSGKPVGATIKSGGCGAASVRNLGNNLLGWHTTIPAVAQIAVDCGARYDGGTTISTLLNAMQRKYGGFDYKYTTDDNAAFAAVKNGAMCIIHTVGAVGGTYNKLLSTSGHFMCLVEVDNSYGYIIDSCSSRDKWKARANRQKYCHLMQSDGLVRVTLPAIRAAIDYYYIVTPVKNDNKKMQPEAAQEVKYTVKNLEMRVNGSTQNIDAVNVNGHNYVRLDQLPKLLPVTVGYDGVPIMDTATINVAVGGNTAQLPGGIIAPGKSLAYVADLARALGYDTAWDSASKSVVLTKHVST